MNTVTIFGSWWGGNLGDTAILKSTISLLPTKNVDEIYIQSTNPKFVESYINDNRVSIVSSVTNYWGRQTLELLRQSDKVIIGGGGLFFSRKLFHPFHNHIINIYMIILCCKLYNTEVHIFSAGISHIDSKLSQWLTKQIFSSAATIGVRDQHSRKILHELGITNVSLIPDPAFTLKPNHTTRVKKITNEMSKKTILLNLHDELTKHSDKDSKEVSKAITETVSDIAVRNNYDILLINNYTYNDWIFKLTEYIHDDITVHMISQDVQFTPEEMVAIIEQASRGICSQMHMVIFALVADIPVVGIRYDRKVESMLRQFGLSKNVATLDDAVSEASLKQKLFDLSTVNQDDILAIEKELIQYLEETVFVDV